MSQRDNVYVFGSTARALKRNNEPVVTEVVRRTPKQKPVQFRVSYAIMILVVAAILITTSMRYITLQSDVTMLINQKGHLMSEYESAKASNDLYYESILSQVDLKEIERIAVEDLGMKMAGAGQILSYSGDVSDYVKQYTDVPQ